MSRLSLSVQLLPSSTWLRDPISIPGQLVLLLTGGCLVVGCLRLLYSLPRHRQARTARLLAAALAASLVLCHLLPASPGLAQASKLKSADEIRAGYEARRATLIQALITDPGGNLWHAASKGLALAFRDPEPPLQALMYLQQAAGADPKCEECCEPPEANQCGSGAGYWSLPLLIRAYYMFRPDSDYQGGRYAGRIPFQSSQQIKGFYSSYLRKGAGKGYGDCAKDLQPRCRAEYSIDRYNYGTYTYISQSDNHTMVQASTILLAAQMLKEDSTEYAELYENWRDWWSRFLDGQSRRALLETASPTYVERHLAPIYNLYDFAEDELIRRKAEMLLDWYWAEIAQELLHGVRGGAKMRVYSAIEGDRGSISARNDAMYGVYYLYFGDSSFETDPMMPHAEMYTAVFATSAYSPPDVVLELGANPEARGSFEIKERRKGSCFVWDRPNEGDKPYSSRRYAYVTPDYVLGSFQTDADKQFMPIAGQTPHLQNSLVFATSPEARIAWGESGAIGSGQLNVFQHKNVVIASRAGHPELRLAYDLPAAGVLDRIEEEDPWLFIQEGNAYAAIRGFHEVMIIEAARSVDYGHDFEKFKLAIRQTGLALLPSDIDSGFIQYTTTAKDVMWFPLRDSAGTCRYGCACSPSDEKLPRVNGQVVDWRAYPLFSSLHVNSEWDSGLVKITFGGRELMLDFRDPDNPIKTESSPHKPTATPVATATATSATSTATPVRTATSSPAPTRTATPVATATAMLVRTATATSSPELTSTVTPLATASATATTTPVASPTLPSEPTETSTLAPTATHTATPEGGATATATSSPTAPPATATALPTATSTSAPWPSPTPTPGPGGRQSWIPQWLQGILRQLADLLRALRDRLRNVYQKPL